MRLSTTPSIMTPRMRRLGCIFSRAGSRFEVLAQILESNLLRPELDAILEDLQFGFVEEGMLEVAHADRLVNGVKLVLGNGLIDLALHLPQTPQTPRMP